MLSESEIEQRIPVWNALSELFLDTELDEISHRYIGKVILESEYKPEEIHNILWQEVFPSVGDNLRCVAGEWAGFDSDSLKERILSIISQESVTLSESGIISINELIKITKQELSGVCRYLPNDFSKVLLTASKSVKASTYSKTNKWRLFRAAPNK
ncbi:hypothetical protein NO559_11365 [Dasania sp. GY-MA-18]|uniref:DUF7079 domain-containing protein n=1 Tax=Dasania phycosphaerae TaxID=2950436 RepID=A0A9J6RNB9_9GAMM|nr:MULTISPECIES: hypothetical protein [Dasania]MCR8923377.1 hypothetical protein [Dasania sp. GY-MA-18]MCZ0865809.1 hypothetical protein [Dasania phycosphaerae]MCZ0869534.1 hypothetical protein [Dasania phycosphaerae]